MSLDRRESSDVESRKGIGVAVAAIAAVSVIVAGSLVVIFFLGPTLGVKSPPGAPSANHTIFNDAVVMGNASQYFPNGYYSQRINISLMTNGTQVVLGGVTFTHITRSSPIIDYTCPSYFYATLLNGSQLVLDPCYRYYATRTTYATVTTSISGSYTAYGIQGYPGPWSIWAVSKNTVPTVGIHTEGFGDRVALMELVVGK
jgi:hypothetical protein